MNFRRIFFFGMWLAIGVVGVGIVVPELNRARSGNETAAVNRDMPPEAEIFSNIASEADGQTATIANETQSLDSLLESAVGSPSPGSGGSSQDSPGLTGLGQVGGGAGSGMGRGYGASTAPAPEETAAEAQTSGDDWPEGMPRSGTSGPLGYNTYNTSPGIGSGGSGKSMDGYGRYPGLGSGGGGKRSAKPGEGNKLGVDSVPHPSMAAPGASDPSATETDDLMAELDRKLASLPLANIAFNTPRTIPLGEDAMIELLLSLQETEDQLREAIRAAGPTESARIQISDQMEARLTGLGFRIEAITPDRQAVSRGQRTWWRWQIEPTKSDALQLHLTLSAIVSIDGVPAPRTVQTFERTIYVKVPPLTQIAQFAKNNVEIITTFILIPVAGGLYRYVRKKKRSGTPADFDERPRRAA